VIKGRGVLPLDQQIFRFSRFSAQRSGLHPDIFYFLRKVGSSLLRVDSWVNEVNEGLATLPPAFRASHEASQGGSESRKKARSGIIRAGLNLVGV
jgi:hypothetical protein